jgi:hypothetical protein
MREQRILKSSRFMLPAMNRIFRKTDGNVINYDWR